MTLAMILEFLVVLAALYVGSRYGSLALGAISGIGLFILVLCVGMKPGNPPTDVIYIIIAAITCAGMMHAAGGMDWLIQLAEKLLRKHPNQIIFLAPLCTFFLTVLVGTGHVVYTLMPIIADISLKKGIRPERPCAVASIASQVGITCSPISAAVASFVVISGANSFDVNNVQVVAITIPSCLCGILMAALVSYKRGKDLDKDPEFQARLADPETKAYMYGSNASVLDKQVSKEAKISVFIFLGAIALIVFYSLMQIAGHDIRPQYIAKLADGSEKASRLGMNLIIQIVLITAAAVMIIFAKASPKKAVSGAVWQSGMVAVVAIYGIAWLADTYFSNYLPVIESGLKGIVERFPWTIAFAFFAVSVLINSQGATLVAMLPLAYKLGIPGPVLLGVMPSVYAYFFIPNYPSDIATVNFDRSGTTKIGKYLLNHSFMLPGLTSVITSTIVGTILVKIFY
ncbi:anaerobic C4-dicarboxylate transporter [Treponema bryantii]|uniref:anaerobic C4-dicarboxylate transporter n=1 Tax=Treponema bryantii TaxID=163 RepID=UPI0003B6D425|nr:anaerobic C4-dicarboxylate transporter [Treponema bryantii]